MKFKAGTRVKIVETRRRKLNKMWISGPGEVMAYINKGIYRGKFRVRMDRKRKILHWYPEELKSLEPLKLKQFSAWK